MSSLITRREGWIWAGSFLLVAVLLVVIRFASDDPDSALYADLSSRLAAGPASRWIAPEWWGNWDSEGLFREHPAGVFLLPAALGAVGVPAAQGSYIVGIAAALASVLILGELIARIASPVAGRHALVLLQVMPLAFIFRIRANHEYPMLLCLLVALVGIDAARRDWRFVWITPVALTAALLVKGVFVAVPLLALGLWIPINPTRAPGSWLRPAVTCLLSLAVMAGVAVLYDALYLRATGETFWGPYWARQLAPLTLAAPGAGSEQAAFGPHLRFYLIRMLWHPAPWSFALLAWGWMHRRTLARDWTALPIAARRSATVALTFAALSILMLSPISRFAERYAFSANYAIAAIGVVVAPAIWPSLRTALERLDRAIPAFPALLWLATMLLRLALGPLLPRISA